MLSIQMCEITFQKINMTVESMISANAIKTVGENNKMHGSISA